MWILHVIIILYMKIGVIHLRLALLFFFKLHPEICRSSTEFPLQTEKNGVLSSFQMVPLQKQPTWNWHNKSLSKSSDRHTKKWLWIVVKD